MWLKSVGIGFLHLSCHDSNTYLKLNTDRSAIARHEASFFKLVEWSEQLRLVTSVRLGAIRHRVQIRLCTEQWV